MKCEYIYIYSFKFHIQFFICLPSLFVAILVKFYCFRSPFVPNLEAKSMVRELTTTDSEHCWWSLLNGCSGGRLNIKMSSYQYRDSHVKDKTVSPTVLSLTWESPYLGKTVFLLSRGPGVCDALNLKGAANLKWQPITTKQNKVGAMCIFLWLHVSVFH